MDFLEIALGPVGALALAVPTAAYALRKVENRYESELTLIKDSLARAETELEDARRCLAAETQARLADAKEASASLLAVYERVHATLDGLEDFVRRQAAKLIDSQRS